MESPNQNGGIEGILVAFIKSHPEYAEKKFTAEEIHQAAELMRAQEKVSDTDLLEHVLNARLAVRVKGDIAVTNNRNEVIGIAGSKEEAGKMYRGGNEMGNTI